MHEQRQAEARVHSSPPAELEFRRLLDKLPAGAYTCDREGLITYYNSRAVDLWGRAPRLCHPEDRFCGSFRLFSSQGAPIRHEECWMALALRDNAEYNGREIVIERPDGRRLTALAHANPIRDDAGHLAGAVNVLVDISGRKQAEDALREADRSKDEFLATLAHELRNPLAPIRNAVQILEMHGNEDRELGWALEVIDRQMQQMTRLIDDLLDVSRITRNKVELRKSPITVAEIVQTALETTRPLMERGHHRVAVNIPSEPIPLLADRTRLAQALGNLLNNAAKYTPEGGRIQVEAQVRGSQVLISVKDSGVGIPRQLLSRIFDLFVQVDRTLERAQGGLGIGLTLARRLVELHGGNLRAYSEGPGRGSEFIMALPLEEATFSAPVEGPAFEARGGLRILVVDDNIDAAQTLARLLQLLGNDVRTGNDGAEALRLAEAFRPQVVVLDIGLPRMNGYDAARAIRNSDWGREMLLIAVTGWGQDSDKTRSRAAGFDHHLVKPVDPGALIGLLPAPQTTARHSA